MVLERNVVCINDLKKDFFGKYIINEFRLFNSFVFFLLNYL